MELTFNPDKDTLFTIENFVSKYLIKYFNRTQDEIDFIVNNYYNKMDSLGHNSPHDEMMDDLFNHDHPYYVAASIHYHNSDTLSLKYPSYKDWLRENNIHQIPIEADIEVSSWVRSILKR